MREIQNSNVLQAGVFLRQATRLNEFELGKLNFIFAGVGAGKTTYVGKSLPNILNYKGAFIFLAPYKSLKQQTVKSKLFEEETEDYLTQLEGFKIFGDEVEEIDLISNRKIVLTTQKFLWLVQKKPELWNQIGVVVFDEFDHVLYNLPNWNRNPNDPFKKITQTLLQYMNSTYIVAITATNKERLLKEWGERANEIKFSESLRTLKLKSQQTYSDLLTAIQQEKIHSATSMGRIAIFIKQVKIGLHYKNLLMEQGYTVDLLVSDSAKHYTMNTHEQQLKLDIEEKGDGDFSDILIFNSTLERGISIHNKSFTHVFVHDSNEVVQQQVFGRFRFSGLIGYTLMSKQEKLNAYVLPENFYDEWLDCKLTTVQKTEIVNLLNWRNPTNNRQLKWTSISRILSTQFPIEIEEGRETIQGVQQRYSILRFNPTV